MGAISLENNKPNNRKERRGVWRDKVEQETTERLKQKRRKVTFNL